VNEKARSMECRRQQERIRRYPFTKFITNTFLLIHIIFPVSNGLTSIRKNQEEEKPASVASPVVKEPSPMIAMQDMIPETVTSTEHDQKPPANAPVIRNGESKPLISPSKTKLDLLASNSSLHKRPPNAHVQSKEARIHKDFLEWCKSSGIRTNLTVQFFEYNDFQQAQAHRKLETLNDDNFLFHPEDSIPALQVRGLAAKHDITEGEVVISIPLSSLITIVTTIDADPVLRKVMGPNVRQKYEWEDAFFELALLSVALLYHQKLGKASPLHNYISILQTSPTDKIPFLWTKSRLRQEAPEGIRRHAQGIHKDIQDAYSTIFSILKGDYPELFETETYSLENFLWAFAMVNSRHWHLPIPGSLPKKIKEEPENHAPLQGIGDQLPPASLPTEEWILDRGDASDTHIMEAHSFLAPVADLLNFGPPCTRGSYNAKTQSFELVATCPFLKGQEVTYWYSDDCEDIMIANYGFTHPMVPACPTIDDLRYEIDLWKSRSLNFEAEVVSLLEEIETLEKEISRLQNVVSSCACNEAYKGEHHKPSGKSRKDNSNINKHDHIRGSNQQPDYQRHGVRRKAWNHQKSEADL
jgi:SET domain